MNLDRRNGYIVIHKRYNNTYGIGTIHQSNNYGQFKILEYLGYNKSRNRVFKIQFINTGYTCSAILSHIKTGGVKDHTFDYCNNDPNIGTIHCSNNCGEFKIISRDFKQKTNQYYTVEFINTGFKTRTSYANILSGKVQDHTLISNYNIIGKIFKSRNYGDFKVISKDMNDRYFIKFIDTGYKTSAKLGNINEGKVKDFLKPTVAGVGYLGEYTNTFRERDAKLYKSLISRWQSMLCRCYDSKDASYGTYGGSGIKVSERWHNFSNYLNDVIKLPGFNREDVINGILHLDKDKLQYNLPKYKMIYSKDTCCWITREENTKLIKTPVKCVSSDGTIIKSDRVLDLANILNLNPRYISRVLSGKLKSYKGYKFEYIK